MSFTDEPPEGSARVETTTCGQQGGSEFPTRPNCYEMREHQHEIAVLCFACLRSTKSRPDSSFLGLGEHGIVSFATVELLVVLDARSGARLTLDDTPGKDSLPPSRRWRLGSSKVV